MLAAGFDFNTERAHHSILLHPSINLLLYPGVEGGRWKLSQLSFEREREVGYTLDESPSHRGANTYSRNRESSTLAGPF